jgi:dipeptidyl aminopeptidase/acylaminoacyl peptidase
MRTEQFLDSLLSLPEMEDFRPKVSPDGRWVAWTWFHVGPAGDVFAVATDGSAPPLRLTQTAEKSLLLGWTADSRSLLVAQDKDGDERYRLYRVDLDKPLVMEALTEPDPNYFIQGGELHPNGKWLVYVANVDFEQGVEQEASWVYRHDTRTGEKRALARPLHPVRTEPRLNPAGTHILYDRKDLDPAGSQTWLVDIEGKEDREILNYGPDVKTFASWLPDSRRAIVQVETSTHRKVGLWSLDEDEIKWLLDDPSRDIRNAYVPFGSPWAVILQYQQGRAACSLLELESGEETFLPSLPGNLIALAPAAAGAAGNGTEGKTGYDPHTWVGLYYSSTHPDDVVRFNIIKPDPADFVSLSRVWDHTPLSSADFVPAEDFSWPSVDGLRIHGWLYRAKGPAQGTAICIHGGPTWHSQDWISAEVQFYTACGFNVLDINYRGSTGYGLPFREAIREQGWGGLEQEDIRTGIAALISSGIAQEGKIGITGTSYGGYSSWWAITHFKKEMVAAAVPICGMTDLVVDYETTRPDIRPYSEEMMGGSPDQAPERYYQRSPIHFVENIQGKLLIVQGLQDPNVTPQNVSDVVSRLEAAGIPYELLTFEDEGHGVMKTPNQRILLQRTVDFFAKAFRGGRV